MERLRNTNESGKHQPSLELAFRIVALFGKRIEEIFVFVDGENL
jgi:DNA-binding XRE family transcriptional regulator